MAPLPNVIALKIRERPSLKNMDFSAESQLQHETQEAETKPEPTEITKDSTEEPKEVDESQQGNGSPEKLPQQTSIDDSDDIDKMLSELQGFQNELEEQQNVFQDPETPGLVPDLPSKPLDEFRFSLTCMEDTGEVDLDALLEDLCIMEKDLNANKQEKEPNEAENMEPIFAVRPNSPISPTAKVSADVRSRLESVQEEAKALTPEEQQERIKAEKIRIALEKLRAARVKKLVVKVYNDEDPTSKTIAIDQTWTSWEVCKKMMRKNDAEPDPNWVLLERLPELCIERFLEDHESVVDVVSSWPWENENKLYINNKREKYALFRNPQNYLLSSDTSAGAAQLAEKSKDILLQEYFKEDAMRLPELDGVLYLKEGKKSWKKHYFALRASGIYYTPKGKTKSSRDLVCLIKFEFVSVYTGGAAFKKKFKAPTEHCFILKHPDYHDVDSKAIKYFCAEDSKTLSRWIVCIKLAKYGFQLLENYSETQDEMDKLAFTLDKNRFPKAASFSVGSRTEENGDAAQSHIYTARETAKAQADKLRQPAGSNYIGSQSFSVTSSKFDKRKPKKIGNLFSDAWKKGTEHEERNRPISPDTPSTSSTGFGGMTTPNTTEPRAFNIENAIIMDEIEEEQPPVRPRDLPLFGPSGGSNGEEAERIPSPSEIKSMLETVHSPPAPPLPPKAVSFPAPVPVFPPSAPMPPPPAPLPPQPAPPPTIPQPPPMSCSAPMQPGPMSFSVAPLTFPAAPQPPPPPKASSEPPPPPPVARKPSRSGSNASQRSFELPSPGREAPAEVFATAGPPLPPPVSRKPSRSGSNASQRSIEFPPPSSRDDSGDFPPPPPPPVMRKPSRGGSMNENRGGTSALDSIRGSTDSLDYLPLPPPPETIAGGSDADLPPPPPEVLFKSRLESSLARTNSVENRGRSTSVEKATPPPPPPKGGRPRLNSNGKPPPPPPLRKSSTSS